MVIRSQYEVAKELHGDLHRGYLKQASGGDAGRSLQSRQAETRNKHSLSHLLATRLHLLKPLAEKKSDAFSTTGGEVG